MLIEAFAKVSNNKNKQKEILRETSSGGVSINDTLAHCINKNLPFGGVSDSGMGSYHERDSFDAFSYKKKCTDKIIFLDLKEKYPPYKIPFKYLKRILKIAG